MDDVASDEAFVAEGRGTAALTLPASELAEELHDDQYPALVRFLLWHGASWNEAQDAVQDAFTQMCASDSLISHPKAWLRKVAWRSWVKLQIQAEEICVEPPDSETTACWQNPVQAAEIGEEERRIIGLLLKLPAKQRAAMAWHLDGFTTEESARAMGTTCTAVRQNLSRARATLKSELGLGTVYQADGQKVKKDG